MVEGPKKSRAGIVLDIYFFANYFYVLNVALAVISVLMLISALDDFFIDIYFWIHELYRRIFVTPKFSPLTVEQLLGKPQQYLAVMAPAWKEYDVIAQMIENTLATMNYDKFIIFAGTYQNDAETTAEVDRMVRKYPERVCRATVLNDGPTCKSDCLNWIVERIFKYEQEHGIEFSGMILHDSEDVIHPLEFRAFNYLIDRIDMIQLPVLSLPRKWHEFVGESYADDFAEQCQKEMVVRESMTGVVPGCGVSTCYSRRALKMLAARYEGIPFNITTLTEDYDLSFRLKELGARLIFMRFPILETVERKNFFSGKMEIKQVKTLIAVREYFPNTFRTAYRQRARWVLGQAFQGWQQLGWKGSLARKYLFFRDRKSVITPFVGFVAYLLLLNVLVLYAIHWAGVDYLRFPEINLPETWVYEVATANIVLFTNRILHRIYFTWKLHGVMAGLRVLPHIVVGNLINFMAVSRAWKLFIIHLYTGKKIGWDKTAHTFLEGEVKAYRKVGEILALSDEQCAEILAIQSQTNKRFGQLCLAKGWVDSEQLADALADQAHFWRGDLSMDAVREYAHYLSAETVREYQVIPFALGQTGALHLAVTHLCSGEAQAALAKLVRQEVLYFVVPDHQFEQAMQLENGSVDYREPNLNLSPV